MNDTGDVAANDGDCTLREAITAANTNSVSGAMPGECAAGETPAIDTIEFSAAFDGAVGTSTITVPTTQLPAVTEDLIINAADGVDCDQAPPMGPCVGIDVTAASTHGLVADNTLLGVRALAVTGADTAIRAINGAVLNVKQSWFGIKLDQSVDRNRVGVETTDDAEIGGTVPSDRNVFAANSSGGISETGAGVYVLGADGNEIQGNYFGVAPNGALAAGMENGVNIRIVDVGVGNPAEDNTIGGPDTGTPGVCDGSCNLLANAIGDGIDLIGLGGATAPTTGTFMVIGNFIGLGPNGSTNFGNGGSGVVSGSAGLELGGPDAADRNYIAGNDNTGVFTDTTGTLLAQNNYFGVNAAGTAKVPANPSDTERTLSAEAPDADILDNRFGGAFLTIGGDDSTFQGNVVGVGTGGQDVGMEAWAVFIAGDDIQFGGPNPGDGNVIGYQKGDPWGAVEIAGDTDADNATMQRNFIGTDASGASYPNEGVGIDIPVPFGTTTSGNVIGGDTAAEENVISNSGNDATRIEGDGVDVNQILRNRGRNNGRLDVNGPKNDLFINLIGEIGEGNTSDGPNAGIAAPGIGNGLSSSATTTRLTGTSGEPNGTEIHVFTTFTRYADIKAFVAEGTVINGAWSVTYPAALTKGTCITASQTNPAKGTSELAPPVAVSGNGGPCDRIRPRTRLTRVRKNVSGAGGSIRIRFKSNETKATFQCSRQRSGFRRCRSPKAFRRLPFGQCHRIRVRAVDQAGNKDRTPARVRFCVPPE